MKNRYLTILVVLIVLSILINHYDYDDFMYETQGVDRINSIPRRFDDWVGIDINLDPIVFDILETKSILHRLYRNSRGQEVFLSIVFYFNAKIDFHTPESCLGGRGIKIEKSPATVQIHSPSSSFSVLKVNQLLQIQDTNKFLIYYFYKTGQFIGRSYLKLRYNLAIDKFISSNRYSSLIRVSTKLSTATEEKLEKDILKEFITSVLPYVENYL